MNRNGIGTLVRAGSGPARGGIGSLDRAHVARGEMVLPREAMQASPGLRAHAQRALAGMGRDPARFTMGGRNRINPRTGAPEFADLVYDPNGGGWVDANTGQAATFDAAPTDSYLAAPDPTIGWASGQVRGKAMPDPQQPTDPGWTPGIPGFNPYDQPIGWTAGPAKTVPQMSDPQIGWSTLPSMPKLGASPFQTPIPMPISTQNGTPMEPVNSGLPATQQGMAGSGGSYPDFSAWTSPQTYDQWRETRNPAGKNAPNVLFGQAAPGADQTPFGGQTVMGDASGQMPVGNPVPWSIPGTSLGFASDAGNSTPSMLNNGYQPYQGFNPFDGLFGGNQNGGISFGAPSFGQQQQQQTPNYAALFKSY